MMQLLNSGVKSPIHTFHFQPGAMQRPERLQVHTDSQAIS